MDLRWWRLGMEMLFVLSAIIVLKIWVFPFFISIWFPADDLAAMLQEWTVIMVGIITCFIYLGLGSSAKHVYQLSKREAAAVFLTVHFPVVLWAGELYETWVGLIKDLVQLFLSPSSLYGIYFLTACFALFLLGRGIRVKDEQQMNDKVLVKRKNS
ncbi:hypothetical protein [Lihuaxuella thermophila]|uniref:Uncharacterized protein n=1 Tax=Lihuaxuella thermophila TaxID=1173111 RepID=A0A1H8F9D2_9BACL|nr:hypothetical protein [Lihuaxuella thermophila]SEN28339.1 hypothetical protein SAMN05444955_10880 [Lihuaxuella thermophila]